jgi:predicted secreted protein
VSWKTVLAIYLLFWIMSAFLVLPFEGRKTGIHESERVGGQENGAPPQFRPGRVAVRTTILSSALFAAFYANYVYGWVTLAMLGVKR